MKLNDIKPYPKNAKKHDQTQISNVAQSIKEFGFVQPIVVDKNNVIIIGHCRYLALLQLGYKEIPNDWVKKVDLSETDAARLRILDNKTNESAWDFDLLKETMTKLDFSVYDIDWNLPTIEDIDGLFEEDKNSKEKDPKTVTCPKCGNIFEV
ncbi:MAG: ParB/Srx family N-terminal domain-containing protein [Sphaerochaetaceae bacterium]|jgi:ParB family chromosome partitioning protein